MRSTLRARKRSRGIALLLLLALITTGVIGILISQMDASAVQRKRDEATARVLARAKEALISYAVTYPETHLDAGHNVVKVPGYLPCPETNVPASPNSEGVSTTPCGLKNVSVIGRFPWKTLGLDPLRDGNGECLWLVVSGTFKASPETEMMNWDTNGLLTVLAEDGATFVMGATPETRAAAVIIAPGPALAGEDRSPVANTDACGGNYSATDYMESSGGGNNAAVSSIANAVSTLVRGSNSNGVNDRLLEVSASEIFDAVEKRNDFAATLSDFSLRVTQCIANYGKLNSAGLADKRLPWTAPVNLASYVSSTSYDDDEDSLSGRVPFRVSTSKSDTSNNIVGNSLLISANCPVWSDHDDELYQNWKDQLFYALGDAFKPDGGDSTCPSCLKVNGVGSYSGIVAFSGRRLVGKSRATSGDKSVISNYLEGRNSTNHPNASGDSDYQTGPVSPVFNDVLFCIDSNLSVAPCP